MGSLNSSVPVSSFKSASHPLLSLVLDILVSMFLSHFSSSTSLLRTILSPVMGERFSVDGSVSMGSETIKNLIERCEVPSYREAG